MPTRFLYRSAVFCERHYRSIFAITAVLVLVSIVLTTQLSFDPDILSLLPDSDPVVKAFRDTLAEFGGLDLLLIVVRVPEGAATSPYFSLVDALGEELATHDSLQYVEYRISDPADLLRSFFPQALFFTDTADRVAVAEHLSDEAIAARIPELRRQLATPQAIARKDLMLLDPLGLSEVFIDRLRGGGGPLALDWSSGYYLSRDHRLLLLLAKPDGAAQDLQFAQALVNDVEGAVADAQGRWEELGGDPATPPEVVLGGGYLTALDDANLIRRDVIVNAVSSMTIVLLLFLFAFRRLGLLLFAFIPLFTGLILNFGLARLFVDKLSSATSVITALLVGLGIDFVIVSYGRYVEERHDGATPTEALQKMTGWCGRAVVVGGVTSAATFYSFSVTEFTGLRQMGILTATGILLCMVSVLVLLPAMLAWSERRHADRDSTPTLYVHGFGAGRLVDLCLHKPRVTLWIGGVITLAAALLIPRLETVWNIQKLRPDGNRGIQVQGEVAQHFGTNFKYMMLVLEGERLEDVLDLADRATRGAQALVEDGVLDRVGSISSLLPSPIQQREVLEWLEQEKGGLLDFARVRGSVEQALAAAGLRAAPFTDGLDLLQQALSRRTPIELDEVRAIAGAETLIERYLRPSGEGWKSVVYLFPPPDVWRHQAPPAAQELADSLGEGAILTGVNVVSRNLREQVRIDAFLALGLGFVLVAFLLWLDFRDLRYTALSLAPLAVGMIWMVGLMVLCGLSMNFMNIFVTTMILGIGVDYGVHMLHRFRELQEADEERLIHGLSETGRAISMAAVTTSVGFGSLVLSHYPGLRSIGFLAILGAVSTALVAITILPTYLVLLRRRMSV